MRVALVEDQLFTREVTGGQIAARLACQVDGYPTVEQLLAAGVHDYDVVVLDLQLRGGRLEGAQAVHAVASRWPVLVFSGAASGEVLEQARAAGASGYVCKDTAQTADLVRGIETVAAGGEFVDPGLLARVGAAARRVLTSRQQEVLRLEALGLSFTQIARRCQPPLTEAGVRRHIERIVEVHPDCPKQTDRVRLAVHLGLVSPWEVYRGPQPPAPTSRRSAGPAAADHRSPDPDR